MDITFPYFLAIFSNNKLNRKICDLPIPFMLLDDLKTLLGCVKLLFRWGITREVLFSPFKILELERLSLRVKFVIVRKRELDNIESPPP